ncbi:MAG: SRPBCC domain-containing protein [Gemmatimonadota bacterium]
MSREIVEVVEIDTPPERVFAALTTPGELIQWWTDPALCVSTKWEMDLRVGGVWSSRWRWTANGDEFSLGGEVVALEPPRLLVYSWRDGRYPNLAPTTVRYEIEARPGGARIRMTHSGFDPVRADFDDYNGGWSGVFKKLARHLAGEFQSNRDVAIEVGDLGAAERFYSGVLGFPVVSRSDRHLALETGAFCLWINQAVEPQSFVPSLVVSDADRARKRLVEAGCTVVRQQAGSRGFWFRDPFGYVVDVIERPSPS